MPGVDTMMEFLTSVLTQTYVDRQPDLICLLYDELEQERPSHLLSLFSPVRSQVTGGQRDPSFSVQLIVQWQPTYSSMTV